MFNMNQFKKALLGASLILLLSAFIQTIAAQVPAGVSRPEHSYEVSLQVLVGTNGPGTGAAVPQSLSGIVRDLRPRFAFENYRLANTYFGRIGTLGTLEYKSVTSILGQESESDSPSFLEWSIGRLDAANEAAPGGMISAQPFRFGARVPIRTVAPNVVYESIGFNVNKLNFRENTPTLVGTLNLPKTAGTLFLVVTAKRVDE
jgi:hypothetical protein